MSHSQRAAAGVPVLFLVSDTGGGHRAAAQAVADALRQRFPGRFAPVLLDPLSGPGSSPLLRRVVRLYGPGVRFAPWLWGAAYRITDSVPATWLLRHSLLRLADRPVADAATALRPALVVSFHALATGPAVRAAALGRRHLPVVTVVTDLGSVHASWCSPAAGWVVGSSGAAARRCAGMGARYLDLGLPVAADFRSGPLPPAGREALRRELGVAGARFLAVLTGGAEGAGGIAGPARALLERFDDVDVVAICGRNERVRRRLERLARRAGGHRLTVRGFVTNMADWLRCADVVVTKAGPGTIAESACCGAPLILTSWLPGQEAGNAEFVLRAGAGRRARGTAGLLREVGRLRADPAGLEEMRAAAARLGRPGAAMAVAGLIAGLAGDGQRPGSRPGPAEAVRKMRALTAPRRRERTWR